MRDSVAVLLAVILVLCAWVVLGARAHGDAEWIRQGPYKTKAGGSCCGVMDCRRLPDEAVAQGPGGEYRVNGRSMSGVPVYGSETDEFWICEQGGVHGGTPLCFFVPVSG